MSGRDSPIGIGRERQFEVYVGGARGIRPRVPVSVERLERRARAAMTPEAYAYVAGGAGTEETIRENRAAFERWRIVPRMLRNVSARDTAVELFGSRLPSPFVLCPIGVLEMAHRDADIAVARAAAAEGVPMIFSNQASRPMEECARAAVRRFVETYSRPSLSWDDLGFLRERTRLPILLKGILHPADAVAAVEHGMDGVFVSNHGGRQVDGAAGTIDVLPAIVDAVAGRVPVLLDSGVRSGADAFRALALGADAVGLGRPYVWGLAAGGEAGVREVIRNFRADFDLTMGLAGCASIADIGRESLAHAG